MTDTDRPGIITELHGFEAECSICLEHERVPTYQEAEDWLKEHVEMVHGGDTESEK